ncbi:M23 family metallopeptidase [Ferroacidibacillus organovorans]|uniref:M23ase beta-sheet core domain-containing protein n=1 Tax=Ferroacidibacillus organovorans TaxID=1765683 RepID=A0A101XPX1_9BACL|nr:M23 family metallopeptidase [Ferroacidibacillus organovorans]KUO95246.1 hypothetical protein ATW55_14005 [Ferroacidibacillus organovorans]
MNHDDDRQIGAETTDTPAPAQEDSHEGTRSARRGWFRSKRVMYPALYLTVAALIIGLMYVQTHREYAGVKPSATAPVSTTVSSNTWGWPVPSTLSGMSIERGYYDRTASGVTNATLAKELVYFDNGYTGSTGYDFGVANSSKPFPVVAAAGGTVTDVHDSPLMGETVAVSDGNGYSTIYQSLGAVKVKVGEHVAQGQVLGTSGSNVEEQSLGNHLFFEVQKDGAYVNPATVLPKTQV